MQFVLNLFVFLLAVLTSKGFRVCPKRNLFVPPSRHLGSADRYSKVDGRLHIFPELKIPCFGYVKSWRFLTTNPNVTGLYLAIFRPHRNNGFDYEAYDLIAATFVNGFKTTGPINGGAWITFKIKPAIIVFEGDVLGYFYDSRDKPIENLSIRMADRQKKKSPLAIVFRKSKKDFKNTRTVNVIEGSKTIRFPALFAVLKDAPRKIAALANASSTTTVTTPRTTAASTIALNIKNNAKKYRATPSPEILAPKPSNELDYPQPIVFPAKCLNPPVQIPFCTAMTIRAYFDFSRSSCREFYGCSSTDPEGNNFPSIPDCNNYCVRLENHDGIFMPALDPVCSQSPSTDSYHCQRISIRYYFDPVSEQCYAYYGCPANYKNNFASRTECTAKCIDRKRPAVITTTPRAFTVTLPPVVTPVLHDDVYKLHWVDKNSTPIRRVVSSNNSPFYQQEIPWPNGQHVHSHHHTIFNPIFGNGHRPMFNRRFFQPGKGFHEMDPFQRSKNNNNNNNWFNPLMFHHQSSNSPPKADGLFHNFLNYDNIFPRRW